MALPGVFRLPIVVEKAVVTPCALRPLRAEELREELEQALMEELLDRLGEDGEVLTFSFTFSEEGGLARGTLRAECRETVGSPVPLTEEEQLWIRSKISFTGETAQ